jgi:excisionase family DNA binding protein
VTLSETDELIDGDEVCRLGKIKKATLYDWVCYGEIERIKVGRLNRFRKSYILRRFGLLTEEVPHDQK